MQIQIQIKTYKAPVTMKSATGAVQMQIKMKINLFRLYSSPNAYFSLIFCTDMTFSSSF